MNAEYILIPGAKAQHFFKSTNKPAPDYPLYFAKYPVTNKLYRRFIDYLSTGNAGVLTGESQEHLSFEKFARSLLTLAQETEGFAKYLGTDPGKWADTLRSNYDDDKRFNGDEQPVVGITWFAAKAYCQWLSGMQKEKGKEQKESMGFRLPTEEEWEWAASGGKREYPWEKGEPDETRANFGEKVGHTTPVGAYPAGATPEGLMDMAGNVWEWMENRYREDKGWLTLRGGSWFNLTDNLPCADRNRNYPDNRNSYVGFRVARAQSIS